MRRLHLVLSDRAAKQLDELQELWRESTGGMPSQSVLIQRALEEYHYGCFGTSIGSGRRGKEPAQESSLPDPAIPPKRLKAR